MDLAICIYFEELFKKRPSYLHYPVKLEFLQRAFVCGLSFGLKLSEWVLHKYYMHQMSLFCYQSQYYTGCLCWPT